MRISDWSSDVCSSDLQAEDVAHDGELLGYGDVADVGVAGGEFGDHVAGDGGGGFEQVVVDAEDDAFPLAGEVLHGRRREVGHGGGGFGHGVDGRHPPVLKIGRASCRERVWQYV